MKHLLLSFGTCVILLFVSAAEARDLTFTLDCQADENSLQAGELDYQIVKSVTKKDGRWVSEFTLETISNEGFEGSVFELEEASGDSDYLVYQVKNDEDGNFGWITIQKKLKWAKVETSSASYTCK